jgi:hypothetical protein
MGQLEGTNVYIPTVATDAAPSKRSASDASPLTGKCAVVAPTVM